MVLELKEDQQELLEENKLKNLIMQHSQFISYPISLMVKKTRTKTVEVEADESDDDKPKLEELDEKNQDDKVKDEDGKVEDEDGKVEDEEDDEEKT